MATVKATNQPSEASIPAAPTGTAAQVKAVGQVELLFSWLTARYAFGELPALRETLGIALVAGGIVAVVLAG